MEYVLQRIEHEARTTAAGHFRGGGAKWVFAAKYRCRSATATNIRSISRTDFEDLLSPSHSHS